MGNAGPVAPSGRAAISLPNLLAKLWEQEALRRFDSDSAVIRRAAKLALEQVDWANLPMPDRGADFGCRFQDDPEPAGAQAQEYAAKLRRCYERIANGEESPAVVNWEGSRLVVPNDNEWIEITTRLYDAMVQIRNEGTTIAATDRPTMWQSAVSEIAAASRLTGVQRWDRALWAYAGVVAGANLSSSDEITVEIARLDESGFAEKLIGRLVEKYPKEAADLGLILRAADAAAGQSGSGPARDSDGKRNLQGWRGIVSATSSIGAALKVAAASLDSKEHPKPSKTSGSAILADDAWLSPADVQKQFPNLTVNAVGKKLGRWRQKHDDGWREVTERRPREAQYLYRWGAVRSLFDLASETASERRAK